MDALDGNAIGGLLQEAFGTEMTAATGTCAACGRCGPVAECAVYLEAPGTVVRCRGCGAILMVFARIRDSVCTDLTGLTTLEPSGR